MGAVCVSIAGRRARTEEVTSVSGWTSLRRTPPPPHRQSPKCTPLRNILQVVALCVAITGAACSSASATAKPHYWTAAQANAAVIAQATAPYCVGFPNDTTKCAAGKPLAGVTVNGAVIRFAACVGEPAFAGRGGYSRFNCVVHSNNEVGTWTLEVFTAGPAKIRWKTIS